MDVGYVFTFGVGDPKYAKKFVRIPGDYMEARMKMISRFGHDWCWQYTPIEFAYFQDKYPEYTELVEA